MGAAIAATVYGTAAIVAAWFFRPRMVENDAVLRGLIFWLLATPILFLSPDPLLALFVTGVVVALLAPRDLDSKLGYYLITLFAVPSGLEIPLPFPGINHLTILDFPKVAAIVILLPAVVFSPAPVAARYAPAAGAIIFLLTVIYSLQEFRSANLTSGLRATLDNVLLYALPFAAIVRLAPTRETFEKIFSSLIALAVIFAFSAAVSQATSWNFYGYLVERIGIPQFADVRDGLLRVGVTTIPTFAGYVAVLGLLAAEYFRAQRRLGFFPAWIYRVLFLTTAYFTGARGAWVTMAVGLACFWFFTKAPRAIRPLGIAVAIFAGLPLIYMLVFTSDLSAVDKYGSFEYRRALLEAAAVQISQKPLFGDPYFLDSGNFDHLVQGQGIIDVVNYYVQISLKHGLVSLFLYLGAFATVIAGLLRLGGDIRTKPKNDPLEQQRAVVLSIGLSYLVMMATISAVSVGAHLGVTALALMTAFLAVARKSRTENAPAPVPADGLRSGDLYA